AVLRSLLRARGPRREAGTDVDPRRWLAIDRHGFEFEPDLWPNPESQPLEFLAATSSTPIWVVRRWTDRFGSAVTERICRMHGRMPPTDRRPNPRLPTP